MKQIYFLIGIALILAACTPKSGTTNTGAEVSPMTSDEAVTTISGETEDGVEVDSNSDVNSKEVVLEMQNDSGQSGEATLKEVGGKVLVTLDLTSEGEMGSQPAHIHVGSCPEPGAVKYPLENVVDGESETTLEVDMATLMNELPLAVNVHKSAADLKTNTACGDIVGDQFEQ